MVIKIGIAEDCAGLCTATSSAEKYLQDANCFNVRGHEVVIQHLHASEIDDLLRSIIKKRYTFLNVSKRAQDRGLTVLRKKLKLPFKDDDMDIYVNGFPCQPFSRIGSKGGIKDERTEPLKVISSFVQENLPKVVVLEQVKHFTSKTFKDVRRHLLRKVKAIKWMTKKKSVSLYHIKETILDTSKVICPSVPYAPGQSRLRYYLVALRKDIKTLQCFKPPKQDGPMLPLKSILGDVSASNEKKKI